MFIAKQKRKENIAEYILYIWQLEDMLRALNFDMQQIYTILIEPQENLTPEQKEQTYCWYNDLINLLKSEGKTEVGHIEYFMHVVDDLNDLHLQLLKLPVGEEYRAYFAIVEPHINTIRGKLGKPQMSDIEVCFRALYSVVLLRLQGKEANETYINDVIEVISPLIARLAKMYHDVERGNIDLFKDKEE
ncbi:MAG: DUF4924 family protein [Rikenellaceae bacterium]